MQYSVVNYKTVRRADDFRWDGEFLCFEPHKNKNYQYFPIGNILKFAQYGISIEMNEDKQGYKIYRMNEISNMFCDVDIDKYAKVDEKEMKKFRLKDNDVLFNRTNSQVFVGRTGIFKKFSNEPLIFASYLVRFRPDENKILPEYLTIFLNTKYGVQDVKRRARISINQSNVSASELQKVEIPLLSINFQNKIKPFFNKSFELILKSKSFYSQVEQLLLSELGLLEWKPKHKLDFVKNYSDTQKAERFDAEYFQPKYEEIIEAVKKYKNGFDELGNLVKIKDKNFTPKDKETYKYIELANISSNGEINGYMENFGNELPSRARRKIAKGDVITSSIEGSLESIAIITENWTNALCSTGFFAVNSDKINSETLLVLLKTQVGQMQLKKGCKGTILTAISKDELSKIVLPKIDFEIQKQIKEKIIEMYETKHLSKSLLEIAKRGVEMAIEKDEKEAEKWIDDELAKLKK
ncbi:MAG: hypothetical protein WA063_06300 [Minisyncoccia bacterium]